MYSLEQILELCKRAQQDILTGQHNLPARESLLGACMAAHNIAPELGGTAWRSNTAEWPQGAYPGHSLAVIPIEETSQFAVINIANGEQPLLGIINASQVAEELARLTGDSNWHLV